MRERDAPPTSLRARGARSLTPVEDESKARRWSHVSRRLTSATGVLIAIPGLVLVLGVLLTSATHLEMRELARREIARSVLLRARHAEANMTAAFSAADALLDRGRALVLAHDSNLDPENQAQLTRFACRLRDLAVRRPGLAWLSASFSDGTFQGVHVEPGGKVRFQTSRVVAGRTEMTRYDFAGETLVVASRSTLAYDPRQRSFYVRALERRQRVWTDPYPFYPDFHTGITRAEPLFDARGALHAVITADYDMTELSSLLRVDEAGMRVVAFTAKGELLALYGAPRSAWPRSPPSSRALAFGDIADPALRAFFESRTTPPVSRLREIVTREARYVAVEHAIVAAPELTLSLGAVVDEEVLFAPANRQIRRSALSSLGLVVLSALVAALFAIGINRLKSARQKAVDRARTAMEEALDLGSYRLEALLGSGGMGQVFRATHRLLARPAAIKLIRPDVAGADRSTLEARFEREAFTLARLRSPYTVSILDYGKAGDGRLYLVMELLDGLPLDRITNEFGCLPAARVLPILIGVCRSLAEAHAAGLVHRDIKPANVFLCHDGDGFERVKVIDFGLAKPPVPSEMSIEAVSMRGQIAGTTNYMAPEQTRGEPMDARADLYSLGCTAFFLLTGRAVFERGSEIGTILAHQSEQPPDLAELVNGWLPPELARLVARCLSKDPEFRPRSAASLGRALAEISIPREHQVSADSVRTWWERIGEPKAERAQPDAVLAG